MTITNLALIGVALFAIFGAIGAFTIAFRKSQKPADPTAGVSAETRKADRSLEGVRVTPLPEPVTEVEEAVVVIEEPAPTAVGVALIEEQRVIEVSPEESGVTRRQFFNRALSATFFSFLGLMAINSLAFFWPKLSGGFGSDVDAGVINELKLLAVSPAGTPVPVFIPEARAYVVLAPTTLSEQFDPSVVADGLMALFQKCVHLGCRVPWCATSIGFECPCHGSKYNGIGEYFGGPAPRNLDRFVVEAADGHLIIRTGSIIQTSRAPSLTAKYPQGPSCIGAVGESTEA